MEGDRTLFYGWGLVGTAAYDLRGASVFVATKPVETRDKNFRIQEEAFLKKRRKKKSCPVSFNERNMLIKQLGYYANSTVLNFDGHLLDCKQSKIHLWILIKST